MTFLFIFGLCCPFNPNWMKKLLLVALSLLASGAYAQNVIVNRIELAGEKIIVHYELDDSNPANEYQLHLYASKNNFASPLLKVKGDVGDEIKPGKNKRIEWNIIEELGGYKGRISLEVRGKLFVPFVRLQNFDTKKSYKRGKSFNLNWKSGSANPVNIELYKGNERVSGEMNHPNNGAFTMFVPSHVKPGSDYRLKISDAKNSSDVIHTGYFKVTPKVPIWMKILPVVVVGGVVAALAGGGGGTPDPGPPVSESLQKRPIQTKISS